MSPREDDPGDSLMADFAEWSLPTLTPRAGKTVFLYQRIEEICRAGGREVDFVATSPEGS